MKKYISVLISTVLILISVSPAFSAFAAFQYEHNPMDNPKAAQDIVENSDAVYGFSPNPQSKRLGVYADAIDWTDEAQVADAREQRAAYHEKNKELYKMIEDGLNNGDSMEKIARAVSTRRNEIRLEAYKDDPEGLARVKQSNLETYGNENGPTPDFLYEKHGSWQTVIEKACSTNAGMDACLGLYDEYYYTYGIADTVDDMISRMSTEDKIAQMLMPTFRYYDSKGVTALNDKQKSIIAKYGFAGIILFVQNNTSTEQAVQLIDEMQNANIQNENRSQLLISVDQEGAGVTRLSNGTQGPGNMALGATGDSQNAYDVGKIIGKELNAIGYNVDFAPVVDVNNNPSNPVIGVRSFSDDANTVAKFGSAFMKGVQSQKVITALKHFPGHGDTGTDSHTGLPRIEKTYDELKANELIPFKNCIDNGAEMIMTAHIQFPKIEKETYTSIKDGSEIELPATLSKTIITDILRNDMGYDGVVITDAMEMAAINDHFDRLDSAKLAINAGVDIILIPVDTGSSAGIDNLEQYIKQVAALADNGTIAMENVNKAVKRILTLKENNGLFKPYISKDISEKINQAAKAVGTKANHEKEWEIAKKSVTLVKNDNMLPITNNEKTVILVPYANEVNAGEYAIDRLKEDGVVSKDMDISVFLTRNKTLDEMKEAVNGAKNVVAIAEQYSEAGLSAAQYSNLDAVAYYVHENGGKIAFISCNLPYDAARLQKGDAILLAYSSKGMNTKPDFSNGSTPTYGVSIPVGIYTAFDETARLGSLPVNIPKLDGDYHYTSDYIYERGYGLQYEKEYHFIEGENQQFDLDKDKSLTFEFDMEYELFRQEGKVYVDGKLVDSNQYTLSKGSTVLTFKDSFTNSLSEGVHTLKVAVYNGELNTSFTLIKTRSDNESENTSDNQSTTENNSETIDNSTTKESSSKEKSSNPKTNNSTKSPNTGADNMYIVPVALMLLGFLLLVVFKKSRIADRIN